MTPLHLAAGMDRVNVCKMLVSMMMVTIAIEVHQKIVNAQGAGVELHTRVANARGKMLVASKSRFRKCSQLAESK